MATATPLSALIAPWSSAAYTTTSSEPSGPRRCTDVPRAATTVMSRSSDDSTSETALSPRVPSFHSAVSVARSLASIASRTGTRLGSVLMAAPSSVPSSARIFTMRPMAESGPEARRERGAPEVLGSPAEAGTASRTAPSAAVRALTSAEPHEVTEEEILALRERPHVLRPEVEDEESADPDVRDLRAVGRPCRDDVVAGLADGPHAGAVARGEEELGGDVEVREPGSLHARHCVTGAREDEFTAARLRRRRGREARRLQVPPAVLRLEEGPRVRAVDVRGPEPVGLALVEVHVPDLRAVG